MSNKVIDIKSFQRSSEDIGPQIELGVIYLEIYVSPDNTVLSFIPSFELDNGLDADTITNIGEMLKVNFSDAIDRLLSTYEP